MWFAVDNIEEFEVPTEDWLPEVEAMMLGCDAVDTKLPLLDADCFSVVGTTGMKALLREGYVNLLSRGDSWLLGCWTEVGMEWGRVWEVRVPWVGECVGESLPSPTNR